jgi:hypothetical protein
MNLPVEVQATEEPPIPDLDRSMKLHPPDRPRGRGLPHDDLPASLALARIACPDRVYHGFLTRHFRLPRLHLRCPDGMNPHAVSRS